MQSYIYKTMPSSTFCLMTLPLCMDATAGVLPVSSPDPLLSLSAICHGLISLNKHVFSSNAHRALNESLEQLENMKEHTLFLIDLVISSLITSACQGKASDS